MSVLEIHNLLSKGTDLFFKFINFFFNTRILMEKGLDIPLAERLSILFLSMLYSLSHTRAHTHTGKPRSHISNIYIGCKECERV